MRNGTRGDREGRRSRGDDGRLGRGREAPGDGEDVEVDLMVTGVSGLVETGLLEFQRLPPEVEVENLGDDVQELGEVRRGRIGLREIKGGLVEEGENDGLAALEGGGAGIDGRIFDDIGELGEPVGKLVGAGGGAQTKEGGMADGTAKTARGRFRAPLSDAGDGDIGAEPGEQFGLARRVELVEVAPAVGAPQIGEGFGRWSHGSGRSRRSGGGE